LAYLARDNDSIRARYGTLLDQLLDYSLLYALMVVIVAITLLTGALYVIENWSTVRELYGSSSRITESE